jgi:calcineurin-like phosphoesterase family protein
MSRLFFTADLHFGHVNVLRYCDRPWGDVDAMNAGLIDNWNSTVNSDDTVFVLGDVCLGKLSETLPLVEALNGIKFLLPGNHDRVWSGHKKPSKFGEYYGVGFRILRPEFMIDVEVYKLGRVNMSHFPYEGDSHDEDRFAEYRPQRNGLPLLHGHVHDKWLVIGDQIIVGVDVHDYRPVSVVRLRELLP